MSKIISCKEAKQQNLEFYFTGKPCKRNHLSERFVKGYRCKECSIEYQAEYYKINIDHKKQYRSDNIDKIKERQHSEYIKNKDKYKLRNKEYWLKNKNQLVEKNKKYREKNREYLGKKRKEYYYRNKEYFRTKSKEYRENNKEYFTEYNKEYRENNKESIKLNRIKYYEDNREYFFNVGKNYREKNKDQLREYNKRHRAENIEYYRYIWSVRRASKLQATPKWADQEKIKEIYKNCPEGHHVDHIVPLQGKLVCGLHVANNLQYLTAEENMSKGNRFKPLIHKKEDK